LLPFRNQRAARRTSTHPPFLGDVPAATAILDRFLAHATIVQMTGKRFRLRRPGGCSRRLRPWTVPPTAVLVLG